MRAVGKFARRARRFFRVRNLGEERPSDNLRRRDAFQGGVPEPGRVRQQAPRLERKQRDVPGGVSPAAKLRGDALDGLKLHAGGELQVQSAASAAAAAADVHVRDVHVPRRATRTVGDVLVVVVVGSVVRSERVLLGFVEFASLRERLRQRAPRAQAVDQAALTHPRWAREHGHARAVSVDRVVGVIFGIVFVFASLPFFFTLLSNSRRRQIRLELVDALARGDGDEPGRVPPLL